MNTVMIDVREKDEFFAEHIANSIHIPLSHFTASAPGFLNHLKDRKIVFVCRSGARAKMALDQAIQLGFGDLDFQVYPGGILQWKAEGKPVVAHTHFHLPLMRQVQIGAGVMVLLGTGLGWFIHPAFYGIAAFVGAGLTFAGATGFCLLANLLHIMPWNRLDREDTRGDTKELCEASPSNSQCKSN